MRARTDELVASRAEMERLVAGANLVVGHAVREGLLEAHDAEDVRRVIFSNPGGLHAVVAFYANDVRLAG